MKKATLLSLLVLGMAAAASAQSPAAPAADHPLIVRSGTPDGAAQLTVFCDLQEEACDRLVIVLRRVVETYPKDVGVTFRHHAAEPHKRSPDAYRAALAAARQGKGWEMLDMICANADRLDEAGLGSMAGQLRLDLDRFAVDVLAGDVEQVLKDDEAAAKQATVDAVPAVLLNGTRVPDAVTFDAIDAALKAAIGK